MYAFLSENDHDEIVPGLRRDTLTPILIFAAIASWSGILLGGLFMPITPIAAVPLWLAFEAVCAAALWLRSRYVLLSIYLLIVGLFLCSLGAVIVFSSPVFLYLSSSIPLVSSILLRRRTALGIAVLGSAGIIVMRSVSPLFQDATGPTFLWWFVLLCGFAALNGLHRALQMALSYQAYAIRQMDEARAHRAQLMQLTRALQETRQELEKSNVQLRHISLAAEEARSLKAQFAANVSHELRTPINLIVGFAEMIITGQDAYGQALPSVYWRDINTIYRNAKHLQSLINDVLDISQIEAGRMAVVKEHADPREVILGAIALVRDSIVRKDLEFVVQVPDELPTVWIDRLRIRQVILNLLGNAIRFTDQGRITVQAYAQDALLYVSVTDTGIGIPPPELDRVFEEFHQIEGSLSRRHGGSGLGLTLSKQFAELHGGRLWVESEGIPGRGSKFCLTLPLEASPALALTYQSAPLVNFSVEERYFVVLDDDPAIAQLFERHTMKHRAIGARTIAEAYHLMERIYPSALVIDAQGATADDRMAALSEVGDIPIIRCPLPSGQRYMKAIGIADYLVKPISAEALHSALRRLNRPIQTILIVDDDQDVIRLYSHLLQNISSGYQVRKAYSGIEALEIIRRSPPDVLILDMLLSDISGSDVIAQLKASPALETIPIILASAYNALDAVAPVAQGEIRLGKRQGFQPSELVRCIEALVDALTPSSAQASTGSPAVPEAS
ncbi:MAG TPA: ATP-binding protein [Aggregatilineaceae bacterium]|nr:ATP-binding protein [Aggregatilineaceae bacterium]